MFARSTPMGIPEPPSVGRATKWLHAFVFSEPLGDVVIQSLFAA